MVDAKLGAKRTCPKCEARFYDLNNQPIVCPACAASFVADPILPSKADQGGGSPAAAHGPGSSKDETPAAADEVLDDDDVDDPQDDDETAAISDVDLGDDSDTAGGEDAEGPFLEDDQDDDAGVTGIIVSGDKDDDDT